jgi:lysine 2,3-aminomutase
MEDPAHFSDQKLFNNLHLTHGEEQWFAAEGDKLSFKSNSYYLKLAEKHNGIRKQVIPEAAEFNFLESESPDPLAEKIHSPLPRMIHRYKNRIAVLVTDTCSIHCRHCFRRSFTGKGHDTISQEECDCITAYLNEHKEVQEVLLTGGDILTLTDDLILNILGRFRAVSEDLVIRLATRIPSVLPGRITPELAESLSKFTPLWMVIQYNHPAELTPQSKIALKQIREAGIPMVNQSVLLKGINDDSDTLAQLFQGLLSQGVKPYYLFQGDLAQGTSHFRVSLSRGWQIMDELRQKVSGLALPTYAVDLPGGGGKIPLTRSLLVREDVDGYVFKNSDDQEYRYPREES